MTKDISVMISEGAIHMVVYRWFIHCLAVISLCLFVMESPEVHAATFYPLQSKYPELIMYKANTNQKVAALTFDDGPDQRFTPKVLDVLNKHHVKATFFLLGTRVQKYPNVVKRIRNEGHAIGNHTYWHPDLSKSDVQTMVWEIEKNEQEIMKIIDLKTNLFRAPYGAFNDEQVKKLRDLGYRGVGWSIDTEDWRNLPPQQIKQNVLHTIHPGAIILMHSAGHWTQDLSGTVEALDEIIPFLRQQGYQFVTVPELWTYNQGQPEILK